MTGPTATSTRLPLPLPLDVLPTAPTHEAIAEDTDAAAEFVECDVTAIEDLEAAVSSAGDFRGLDVMVNNAGIWHSEEFLDVSEDDYRRLVDVDLKGTYFGSQVAIERMVEDGGGGSVVNSLASPGCSETATGRPTPPRRAG